MRKRTEALPSPIDRQRRLLVAAGATMPIGATGCERDEDEEAAVAPVKRWLKRPGSSTFEIPPDYLGMHADNGVNPKSPSPTYAYDAVRSVDVDDAEEMPATHWSRIEREPGRYHWREVDRWVDGQKGKTIVWTLFGCPSFYQRYPREPWAYPYLPGGGSPPRNPDVAGSFVKALIERYGSKIGFIEVWNEPNFGNKGNDPLRHRWTPDLGMPAFFTGTAADLAQLARALKRVVPPTAKVIGCAWEGQSDPSSRFNSALRFSSAPDGSGGTGKDNLDALSVHSYTYDGNANKIVDELLGYEACFAKAGYPQTMPRYVTEVGAEKPKFWTADVPPMAEKIRMIQRWCMVPAALGYRGVYLYKHGLMRTLGDPARTPQIAEAISTLRQQLRGRVVVRAAELQDGSIWMRFKDGDDLRA
ncbi:MAG: hypothetical protein ABWZ78_11705 [Burkholderiaceae bacterium]